MMLTLCALMPKGAPLALVHACVLPSSDISMQSRAAASLSMRRDTLVCDDAEEAKRLALAGPERHKVVALNGTFFNGKSGNIAGGYSTSMEKNARRFDDHALEALKQVSAAFTWAALWRRALQACRTQVTELAIRHRAIFHTLDRPCRHFCAWAPTSMSMLA